MPITSKGREIMSNMKKEYGDKKGEQVFYASKNKGTISGVEGKRKSYEKTLKKYNNKYGHPTGVGSTGKIFPPKIDLESRQKALDNKKK